jgi:hypothetical protein
MIKVERKKRRDVNVGEWKRERCEKRGKDLERKKKKKRDVEREEKKGEKETNI